MAKKNLESNHGKSRYILLGSEEFKAKTRREAKEAPMMMRSHIMEENPEDKYLGDMVHHTDWQPASLVP